MSSSSSLVDKKAAVLLLPMLLLLLFSTTFAFIPRPSFWSTGSSKPSTPAVKRTAARSPSSRLYMISSYSGTSKWDANVIENPADKVQAYLTEPEAVEARVSVDETCLVSGLVRRPPSSEGGSSSTTTKDYSVTDQFLFDLLNDEESAFEFKKIVCLSPDSKFAKKRLLSRSARYTGLLDKLDFMETTSTDSTSLLPTAEQLKNVKSWLAVVSGSDEGTNLLETVETIASLADAAGPTLENVAILLVEANELNAEESAAALDKLKAIERDNFAYTLVAVGHLEDHPEGREAYDFEDFGTDKAVLPQKSIFSRQEAFRMITELLQLECGKNKALTFGEVYNVNATTYKLVKGLREAGYARPQEIDHMIRKGTEAYKKAIEEFETKHPDAAKGYTSDIWWEQEIYKKSRRESEERNKAKEAAVLDERTKEVETIAREWAKREYFRLSMSNTLPAEGMTVEEFTEAEWERAMLEGDLKYRQSKGEKVESAEGALSDFKAQQEQKEKTMLKRAKEELAQILQEEDDLDDDPPKDDDEEDDDEGKK